MFRTLLSYVILTLTSLLKNWASNLLQPDNSMKSKHCIETFDNNQFLFTENKFEKFP